MLKELKLMDAVHRTIDELVKKQKYSKRQMEGNTIQRNPQYKYKGKIIHKNNQKKHTWATIRRKNPHRQKRRMRKQQKKP